MNSYIKSYYYHRTNTSKQHLDKSINKIIIYC
nr:MAG TPA: hypothetical protein [Caudoviricetes sp.]